MMNTVRPLISSRLSNSMSKFFLLRSSRLTLRSFILPTFVQSITPSLNSHSFHHRHPPILVASRTVVYHAFARKAKKNKHKKHHMKRGPWHKQAKQVQRNKKPKKTLDAEIDVSADIVVSAEKRTPSTKVLDLRRFEQYDGHIPVMLGEVLDVFSSPSTPLRSFVDCTLGAAGHSSAIIEAHPEMKLFVGMDVDPMALEKAKARLNTCARISELNPHILSKNFRYIRSVVTEIKPSGVDGILMDLGVSSMQIDNAERGFSLLSNGPLDMRMDPQSSLKALDILESWSEVELGRILRNYGEEKNYHLFAKKFVEARVYRPLRSTTNLVELIKETVPAWIRGRYGWVKTATRIFQALRIAVNDELWTLEASLYAAFGALAPGGRLVVISFHSLEDRIVKHAFRDIIKSYTSKQGDKAEEDRPLIRNSGPTDEKYMRYLTSHARPDPHFIKFVNSITRDDTELQTQVRDNVEDDDEDDDDDEYEDEDGGDEEKSDEDEVMREAWITRRVVRGPMGMILTKRPITPTEEEEDLNVRCRSAKMRVIRKKRVMES